MTTLELAQAKVQLRRVGREYHGPCPVCGHGPGSTPQTSDRLSIKDDGDRWFCRTCRPQGGNIITWLMHFDGLTCPEAHAAIGKLFCDNRNCPAWGKCSKSNPDSTETQRSAKKTSAAPLAPAPFVPTAPTDPADLWQAAALKLVATAHAALLANPEQLAWLDRRGLPLAAVQRYRLGWLAADLFRHRVSWGLPEEVWENNGKEKMLKIHAGLVIPTFAGATIHRLRIRRPEGSPKYLEVPGSGNDRPLLGANPRGIVAVESDLDALLIDWYVGDLVATIPLVSAQAKPKSSTWDALQRALCILIAHDYEPRINETTGKHENPGGQAAKWWLATFPRAKRWPVPVGKDPGEFYSDHQGDIRAWILSGLPPVFHLTAVAPTQSPATPVGARHASPAVVYHGGCQRRRRPNGVLCLVADDPRDLAAYGAEFPDHALFALDEMKHLQGLDPAALDAIVASRLALPGSEIIATTLINKGTP